MLNLSGDFTNSGTVGIDAETYYGPNPLGGSSLAISATLYNAGTINIGGSFEGTPLLASASVVSAAALDNTGQIYLLGNPSTGDMQQAVLDIAGAAPSDWTGWAMLGGQALLEFGSGGITSIAQGAGINLTSPDCYVADAGATVNNSALAGLTGNAGDFALQEGAAVNLSGDFTNSGIVEVDTEIFGKNDYSLNSPGGSALAIAGTLTNSGTLYVGNSKLTTSGIISANALNNTGLIELTGNPNAGNTQQAVLDIASAAPSNWTGTVTLNGQALLEFGSGEIASIAPGAEIYLASPDAYVADAGATASNSALTGLTSNAGDFEVQDGASVKLSGDLTNTGTVNADTWTDYGFSPSGGSSLAIAGTLSNSGTVSVGNSQLTSSGTISANALDNTGTISLTGNTSAGNTQQAILDIAGAAPSAWSGTLSLNGQALLEFGSGEIASIAPGAEIHLASPDAYIADAGAAANNSALTGLTSNAGDFELGDGAAVNLSGSFTNSGYAELGDGAALSLSGDFNNTGTLYIDPQDYSFNPLGAGGSSLAIAGTLTNSSTLYVGNSQLTSDSTVSANALDNTGRIELTGNSSAGNTQQAVLDITNAPSVWTGTLTLAGQALLEFVRGQIASIAADAEIYLGSADGYIADAGATASNSALTGLTSNAGDFELQFGVRVSPSGDFTNTSTVNVDTSAFGLSVSGGSTLAIAGTLDNSGSVNLGNSQLTGDSTISANALDNTGTIHLTGNSSAGNTEQAVLDIANAPSNWTGMVTLTGQALLEFGSGGIASIAQGAEIYLATPDGYIADAGSTASNSALTGLTSNAGDFELQYGAAVSASGSLANTGTVNVDTQRSSGGSSLVLDGALTNTGTVDLGSSQLTGDSTISANALDNTGTIHLTGNSSGGNTQQAVLDIANAPSNWTGTVTLSGQALLEFGSGEIASIAQGAEIYLATPDGYIADAGSTASNSALIGLTSNAGDFEVQYGAAVSTSGNFTNAGSVNVDTQTDYGNNPSGGSSLAIAGALINSGTLGVGGAFLFSGGLLTATSTVSAATLDNTGTINLLGNSSIGNTKQAALDISGAAPSAWMGTVTLNGQALLEFGSGEITSIVQGAEIYLGSPDGYIADAGSTASNSALTGLTSNAGDFELQNGVTVKPSGGLTNSGTINVDSQASSGGSSLAIGGTLTNSGTVTAGNGALAGNTAISANGLDNTATGTISVTGNAGFSAGFTIRGTADNAGILDLYNGANAEAGGLDNTGTLDLSGSNGIPTNLGVIGQAVNSSSIAVGAFSEMGVTGSFTDAGSTAVAGTLDLGGGMEVTGTGSLALQGGSVITPDNAALTLDAGGTLSGYGTVALGAANNGSITATGGNLDITGPVSGAGQLAISNASELELGGATSEAVSFGGNVGTLKLDNPASFSGAIAGLALGDSIDLAGVQATGAVLNGSTLTVTAGSQTLTYQVAGAGLTGNVFAVQNDQRGGTDLVLGTPGPVISGPDAQTVFTGVPAALGPLMIEDPEVGNGTLNVEVSDSSGTLSDTSAGAGTVSGSGTNTLTLAGDLDDINTMLVSLAYSAASAGSDTVTLTVTDANNATVSESVEVTTVSVPYTTPVVNTPAQETIVLNTPSALGGVSISDPYAESTGQQLAVEIKSSAGTLSATGGPGGSVTGQGTNDQTITGTVQQINSYFADSEDEKEDYDVFAATAKDFQVLSNSLNQWFVSLPPLEKTVVGGAAATAAATAILAAGQAAWKVLSNIYYAVVEELFFGDVNLVTFAGQSYGFNAAGEFVLARSTESGDTFQLQARIEPDNNSVSASVITQMAASLGSDRVTVGINRTDLVWIDGNPTPLTPGETIALSGGQVTQISGNSYLLTWDTGEAAIITNRGSYLDMNVGLAAGDGPGTMVGLMGPDEGQTNDFMLPNGTVLQQPLTLGELYGEFANAWRVTQAASLFDYGPGQNTATFTNTNFPEANLTLSDFPAAVVQQAEQAVAAAGITDPAIKQVAEFDYIVSGGDLSVVEDDASQLQGWTITPMTPTPSGPAPTVLGIILAQSGVQVASLGATAVSFNLYLTSAAATDTVVDYTVIATQAGDLSAAAFGGTFPSGSVTIPAGATTGQFTIEVPQGALGATASENLAVQISSPGNVPIAASTSRETVYQPEPGAPAAPQLEYLSKFGNFTFDATTNTYTLDLGAVQLGEPLPTLQFGIVNAAVAPADQLAGTVTWSTVAGYTVNVDGDTASGVDLPAPISAGDSYQGLTVTGSTGLDPTQTVKFGADSETITFDPVDTNASGYTAPMAPITLTIADTLELPSMIYSQAWGDVHIVTYNGLTYNFQASGDFVLAELRIPGDNFQIQMELEPWYTGASVTTIHAVAIALGSDRVTFDWTRADPVWVDGAASAISMADPTLTLPDGTITEMSPDMFKVNWDTGETMTVTSFGSYINIVDGIPGNAGPGAYAGLQGEDEGQSNDIQLADGTVLPQPVSSAQLYGEYANSWAVSSAASLFDGPTVATSAPADPLTLANLPQNLVSQAAALVAAAGITDPGIAQSAELDYLATGDPSFITSAANIQQQVVATAPATVTQSTAPAAAIGVTANAATVTEAASGATAVTFTAYLTAAEAGDTVVDYTVATPSAGFLGAAAFGGTLPSGSVTIAAGQTSAQFTVDVPQGALGATPNENLQVQVSSPGSAVPIFAPTAQTEVVNNLPEPGNQAVPELAYLGNAGAFSFDAATNTYTLNLGGVTQGSALLAAEFAVINAATAPSDNLTGTFSAPLGTGFIVTGNDLASPLGAGQVYQGLYASINTSELGSNGMSLTFNPEDVNDSGYSAALTPLTLKIVDSITAPAQPQVNTPTTIVFPNVHVGGTDSQHVSVTNTAASGAGNLDVTLTASGNATVNGSISQLAPGATDATDLSVGIDTSTAGALSGSVTENFVSDTGNGQTSPIALQDPYIDVFGSVYRLADSSVLPDNLTVHVGDPGLQTITITNLDPNDGYSENLIAAVVGTTGALTASGTTGDIAPQAAGTLAVQFSTAAAGSIGTVTLDLKSDGTGIDGLGVTDLGDVTIPVTVTSGNVPAAAQFEEISGGGTFTQQGASYTLNLGTVSAPATIALGVLNAAAAPADTLAGSFTIQGSSAFTNTGFSAFSGVASGQTDTAPTITLSTSTAGTFSETITLLPVNSNGSTNPELATETLTITGTVAISAPVLIAPASALVQQNQASPVSGGSVSDANAGATVTVTLTDSNGLLSANTNATGGGGTVTGGGSTCLSIAGTPVQVNADLSTLTDQDGTLAADTITVNASDGRGGVAVQQTVAVAVNAPPVIAVPGSALMQQNQATAVTGISVADADAMSTGETITVTLTDTSGLLSAAGAGTITGAGTTNLTVAGKLAEVNADFLTLTDNDASLTADTIAVNANDGRGGIAAPQTIAVTVNAPPAITAPGSALMQQNQATAVTGISVADADAASADETITVTLTDTSGLLSANGTGTITGTGTTGLTIAGTLAQVKADLATLTDKDASLAADSIAVNANDGRGGIAAPQTIAVTVNAPPVIAAPGSALVQQTQATAVAGISVTDADAVSAGETITVTLSGASGLLSAVGTGTITGAGTTGLTIAGTFAQVNADIATLTDKDASLTADSITVNASDSRGGVAAPQTVAVTVNPAVTETVTINPVDGNNVINYAEAHATGGVPITGTETGLAAGATFTVSVQDGTFSKTYTAAVGTNGAWSATIPSADAVTLPNGTATVTAQVTSSVHTSEPVIVAETLPTVTINKINGNDIINNSACGGGHCGCGGGRGPSAVQLSGAVTGIAANSTFLVTVTDFWFSKSYTATVNAAGTGWSAAMPASDVAQLPNGTAAVSAQVTGQYGNVSLPAIQLVTVEGTAPVVLSVSASPSTGDLKAGKTVAISLTMNEPVVVKGAPALSLNDCGAATFDAAHSTSTVLVFDYTVAAGQNTAALKITGVNLPCGASIQDPAGDNANLAGADVTLGLQIDTTPPTVTGATAAASSKDLNADKAAEITLSMSEPVTVSGTPTLSLNDGGAATYDAALSSATALIFDYTVLAGQNTCDLKITGVTLANGAFIHDLAGNAAVLTGADVNLGLQIDTLTPAVSSVAASPSHGTVTTGGTVAITLKMNEAVTVTGSPVLLLNDGGTATYSGANSTATSLVFDYKVPSNQGTPALSVIGLELGSPSAIEDGAGNIASLSGAAANLGLKVNSITTGPAALTISGTSEAEIFGASSQNVAFASGADGTLKLDSALSYTGNVSGLTANDTLDLSNLTYGSDMTVGYSGTAAGGVLSIGNGSQAAHIALLGNYLASSFTLSGDGHGGTNVVDPPMLASIPLISNPKGLPA